jgi:uncharacterized membrane protein YdbT with pleckstrin-like domain
MGIYMKDQRYYEIVAEELQRRFLRPGLWARAVAETGGEVDAARSLYICFRVAELKQEKESDRSRRAAEMERRAVEDARARKQQREAERLAQEEDERHRAQEEEAERWRMEAERAAPPYTGLFFLGALIVVLLLAFLLAHILSR